jgi:hypothetical protein
MGKKQEKKLKVTHCKGKETTEQAEICTNNNKINNPKSQQNQKLLRTANGRAQQERKEKPRKKSRSAKLDSPSKSRS